MLSYEENSGLVTFIVGIVVLVMGGVGLSIVVDKRLHSSSGSNELRREALARESEIDGLKSQLSRAAERLQLTAPQAEAGHQALAAVESEIVATRTESGRLRDERARLVAGLAELESSFTDYRSDYRKAARAAAAGTKIGDLAIRGGRTYHDAVLREVTDVGIEIRHEHGIARIQAPDLGPEWQDRFQWSDEQRRKELRQELENRARLAGPAAVPVRKPAARQPVRPRAERREAAESPEVRAARVRFVGWKSKVQRLEADRSEASHQASYGSQSSVPGSLETWRARAARLGGELRKAESELAAARAELAALSPYDPLLRRVGD